MFFDINSSWKILKITQCNERIEYFKPLSRLSDRHRYMKTHTKYEDICCGNLRVLRIHSCKQQERHAFLDLDLTEHVLASLRGLTTQHCDKIKD